MGVLAEPLRSRLAAPDPEGQHASTHAIAVLLERNMAVRMGLQAGVAHRKSVRRGFQCVRHGCRILACRSCTQVKGFEAAVGQPAVEWRGNGADGVLQERKPLLELVRVECGHAHQDVLLSVSHAASTPSWRTTYRMTIDILGDRVDDNVRSVIERILDVGAQKGIIDHHHDTVPVRNRGDGPDIHQTKGRIARALDPDQFRLVRPDQFGDVQFDTG